MWHLAYADVYTCIYSKSFASLINESHCEAAHSIQPQFIFLRFAFVPTD